MEEQGGPDIEVDEAAAYFGVTESSDVLHAMMAMPRSQALEKFFELLSDIVLRPGDFDFEAASERMQCEGGEIYYLVAGHLGLMSLPDPLLHALGQTDSMGETGAAATLDDAQRPALEQLADPMRMMKLFAVAFQTGGESEVSTYDRALASLLSDVASHLDTLVAVHHELNAALDVAGHVLPIPTLASSSAAAADVDLPEQTTLPQAPEKAPSPEPAEPTSPPPTSSEQAPSEPTPSDVPSPAVPLPTASVALPAVEKPVVSETTPVNTENERQVVRAAQDAFAGAFSTELDVPHTPLQAESVSEAVEPPVEVATDGEPAEFVSAAEHFIAADGDGSGALDIEELAQATGTTLEEATALHAEADTDGDGVVSLSEFIASPAAERTASLPKPVAPVRKPLGQGNTAPSPPQQQARDPMPQQPVQQGWQQPPPQQQGWQQPPPQQQAWQQPPLQQQGWPQPQQPLVQPTIRSGVHCRGCGIGRDAYWRFCPVCGQQNLGY